MVWIALGFFGSIILITVLFKNYLDKRQEQITDLYKGTPIGESILVKKYPEADLKKYIPSFQRVGIMLALALCLFSLVYRTYDREFTLLEEAALEDDFEIEPPQTQHKPPPPPPPPPPPQIEVVSNEEILEEEPEIEDIEIEEDDIVELEEEEEIEEPDFFVVVEEMPTHEKCQKKSTNEEKDKCTRLQIQKYLARCPYPAIAKDNDIQGKVFIRFLIDEKGNVTNVTIARGANKHLDNAAVQHIKKMASMAPGKQRGKPVKVQYIVPINFKLT